MPSYISSMSHKSKVICLLKEDREDEIEENRKCNREELKTTDRKCTKIVCNVWLSKFNKTLCHFTLINKLINSIKFVFTTTCLRTV